MTLDEDGNVAGYDDYYPFGMVMPGRSMNNSNPNSKYKFTGKERDEETHYDYFGARYYDSRIGRWLAVDPLADKHPGSSPYNYTLNNPLKYIDPDGKDVAYFVDPKGAGGKGHTVLFFQDKGGQWYSYNQGAAGETSSGNLGFVSGSSTQAGVSIEMVDGPVKGSLLLHTTSEQDAKITTSAFNSALDHNSGKTKYNLYTNNCTDAAVDVVNSAGAGVTIENSATTVKPNEWFKELKKVKVVVGKTSGEGVDNTSVIIEVPKYEEVK